jgi:hypothetical protein
MERGGRRGKEKDFGPGTRCVDADLFFSFSDFDVLLPGSIYVYSSPLHAKISAFNNSSLKNATYPANSTQQPEPPNSTLTVPFLIAVIIQATRGTSDMTLVELIDVLFKLFPDTAAALIARTLLLNSPPPKAFLASGTTRAANSLLCAYPEAILQRFGDGWNCTAGCSAGDYNPSDTRHHRRLRRARRLR